MLLVLAVVLNCVSRGILDNLVPFYIGICTVRAVAPAKVVA